LLLAPFHIGGLVPYIDGDRIDMHGRGGRFAQHSVRCCLSSDVRQDALRFLAKALIFVVTVPFFTLPLPVPLPRCTVLASRFVVVVAPSP
jgi:hypothetical protein